MQVFAESIDVSDVTMEMTPAMEKVRAISRASGTRANLMARTARRAPRPRP